MSNELKQSIFYIKYYAKKHGYPYKRYLDLTVTEEIDNGKPQYRTASVKWTISDQPTLT